MFSYKRFVVFLLLAALLAPLAVLAHDGEDHSQEGLNIEAVEPGIVQPEKFYVAKILDISQKEVEIVENYRQVIDVITVEIVKGEHRGETLRVEEAGVQNVQDFDFKPGDKVVVGQFQSFDETIYYVADYYRVTPIVIMVAIFFAVAIFFGRWRGFTSMLGLAFTILVLGFYIVPQILDGANPVLVTLVGALLIALVSIFLAHGFNRRTTVALVSTLLTLGLAAVMAILFVDAAKLLGVGSEEALLLQTSTTININLRGLLLAAIIIGTLGVLDDVTTSQTAAVDEISKANRSLDFKELYKRGISVGHEHIAALINTLVLAYAGASLPLFLLFSLNDNMPFWTIINGELIAEEIIRTVVGSTALILAVPIATALAAYFLSNRSNDKVIDNNQSIT